MGLKFYVGEMQAQANDAARMSREASQAVSELQQSIGQFLLAPLSGKAYDSAKRYFNVVYTPLCRSAILTGEAMVNGHKRLISEYQGSVSSIDTDEDLIMSQINRFEQLKQSLEAQMYAAKEIKPSLERRYMNACDSIAKLREKLEKFHAFNARSASFFDEYEACQQTFNNGLAQIANGKAWNASSGTFDLGKLNMTWAQGINEQWNQREKMKQEELKKADEAVVKALEKHGLAKDDLVQVTDTEEIVYQKYIQFAKLGLHPHTGLPLTDSEKVKFQYAAHAGTWSNLIGTIGGAYAANKAANNGFYSKNPNQKQIPKSKYSDFYTYKYNGLDNPGPLNELRGQPNKNFYGGRYNGDILAKPKIYYRGGDSSSPLGQWWTETPPSSVAEIRINSAVKPQWFDKNGALTGISTIDTVFAVEMPAGTHIYKGPVGNQGGIYQGGMNNNQVFIQEPWNLDNVKIIGQQKIK